MKKLKDRRVINIPKSDYDVIKDYCDKNTLDLPKWMVKNSKEKMEILNDDLVEELCDDLLLEDPLLKLKTYKNVNPDFRFTKGFICNVLFPGTEQSWWKIVKDKKCRCFIIKNEIININNDNKEFAYKSVNEDTFISIKNAYKDLCNTIEWGIQENIEDGKLWWVYILDTKDKLYYEE